jgi:hypothetical protein
MGRSRIHGSLYLVIPPWHHGRTSSERFPTISLSCWRSSLTAWARGHQDPRRWVFKDLQAAWKLKGVVLAGDISFDITYYKPFNITIVPIIRRFSPIANGKLSCCNMTTSRNTQGFLATLRFTAKVSCIRTHFHGNRMFIKFSKCTTHQQGYPSEVCFSTAFSPRFSNILHFQRNSSTASTHGSQKETNHPYNQVDQQGRTQQWS